ncbi:MAG TPA: DNA primase [Verrucomicrobiae bacterium]|nr:DNA primase [Verrucomicrobiae bacterium]
MPGFIAPATLERIRAASDIVDVIGSYLPLKRAGANFVALCPFHKEKSPSFNVNPSRQIFHCFGCHKGGDVFTFVKEYESVDFPEALKRLADRAKIPLEFEQGAEQVQSRHLKDTLLQIHEQITQRWQNCLANEAAGQAGRDYLAKRGVTADAIRLFRIGCAPDAWDDTVNWGRSKGFAADMMEKSGLVLRKEGSDHFYDRFRGRLMFPICDEQGRVIAFSGRVLAGDEKSAKYVNSPETPIFTKSKVFFGLDKSKRAILDGGFAIVCEGQLDLIACFMAGVENIVAPQGTALTHEHARILKRYTDEVVLCFDSDNAGQNATVRALDGLLETGFAVRVAIVPAPHDPDSLIKASGADAFRNVIAAAQGFFDYYLGRLTALHDVGTDKGRLAVLREMAQAVYKTGNNVLIDKYAQKTALHLGVSAESVRAEFKKSGLSYKLPDREPAAGGPPDEEPEMPRPTTQELWLLKVIFRHEDLVRWCASHLDLRWIQHDHVRAAIAKRVELETGEAWRNLGDFLSQLEDAAMRSLITEAAAEDRPLPNPAQQLADIATRLRNQFFDRQMQALGRRAGLSEISDAERDELLRQQQDLRQLKRQPLPVVT